jgi:hypothetical protein
VSIFPAEVIETWRVQRINPRTDQAEGEPITLAGDHLHDAATGMGGLWVCQSRNHEGDTLYHIAAQTFRVKELPASPGRGLTTAIAVGDGEVWSAIYQGHGGIPLNRVQP